MVKVKLTEKHIEDEIFKRLEGEFPDIKRQVKLHMKRVDVAYNCNRKTIGLEIKISDWKAALQQAWTNKLACHESYVVLWHEFAHRADKDMFISAGVGLMIVDSDYNLRLEVPPSRKHEMHPKIHSSFRKEITA